MTRDESRPPSWKAISVAPLRLADRTPVARGGNSQVFVHPDDAGLLVKVAGQRALAKAARKSAFWYGHERRYRHLKNVMRAMREQIALYAHQPEHSPHLERIIALVETDLGIGLVVIAARQGDGRLAPTLSSLAKTDRFDMQAQQDLRVFCEWIIQSPLVVNDFGTGNIVHYQDETGISRFMLVDGYGDTATIPIKSWFEWINRFFKVRKVDWLYRKLKMPPRSGV